jgi:hypothetical protein
MTFLNFKINSLFAPFGARLSQQWHNFNAKTNDQLNSHQYKKSKGQIEQQQFNNFNSFITSQSTLKSNFRGFKTNFLP